MEIGLFKPERNPGGAALGGRIDVARNFSGIIK